MPRKILKWFIQIIEKPQIRAATTPRTVNDRLIAQALI